MVQEVPVGSLREKVGRLLPILSDLRKRRKDEEDVFTEVQLRLFTLNSDLNGVQETELMWSAADEQDLTSGHLQALQMQIRTLEEEKVSHWGFTGVPSAQTTQQISEMCIS